MEAVRLPVLDDLMTTMVDADCQRMGIGRAKGCHLSDIIKWLRIKRGGKVGGIEGEQDGLRMYTGFAWERALEAGYAALEVCRREVAKQVKVELDGIHGSPDALDLKETPFVLEEDKLTWRSVGPVDKATAAGVPLAEALFEHFWEWVALQIPGYLHMLSAQMGMPITKCRLHVFFVNGDYSRRPGQGPQVRVWELAYSEQELAEVWRTILSAKRGMEAELAMKEVA